MEKLSNFEPTEFDESAIDTIMDDDIHFEGRLEFSDALMIRGKFKGTIKATGELFVDEDAHVAAKVEAGTIIVKGNITGDVFADTRVELYSCSTVNGNITAPEVDMESGCRFNGICKMESPVAEKEK